MNNEALLGKNEAFRMKVGTTWGKVEAFRMKNEALLGRNEALLGRKNGFFKYYHQKKNKKN